MTQPSTAISPADFDYVASFVRERAAIVLERGKEYLVESRLKPLAQSTGHASIGELVRTLRSGSSQLEYAVVEAMTTNETSWFRDHHPFEVLRTEVLPQLIARRATERTLRIWSAACSSGQEPYTIAMTLRDHFPELRSWKVEILATDLSAEMIAKAKEGRYAQIEANRGLPAALLVRHFERVGMAWQLKPEIRSMVEFRTLNLIGAWPPMPQWDVVFIRNVLIYFDPPTKRTVMERVARQLRPDGFVFLGAAEAASSMHEAYVRLPFEKACCYQKR